MTRTLTAGRPRTAEDWQRLAQRAREKGIEVRRVTLGSFAADGWIATSGSDPGKAYELTLGDDGEIRCTCEAARWGNLCCHAAALAVRLGRVKMPEPEPVEAVAS